MTPAAPPDGQDMPGPRRGGGGRRGLPPPETGPEL